SLFLGLCISWYYINLLFGSIAFTDILKVIFFYGLWFVFIVSLSIFYNTWVRSFGIVAFLTILSIGLVSMLPSIFGEKRSEEHTSELQSRFDLVCRLLLENKI